MEGMYKAYFGEWSECLSIYGHRDQERLSPEEKDVLAKAVEKRKSVSTTHLSPVVHHVTYS